MFSELHNALNLSSSLYVAQDVPPITEYTFSNLYGRDLLQFDLSVLHVPSPAFSCFF